MKTLNEIEKEIDISRFIYKGENIWPIFRNAIGWEIVLETNVSNNKSLSNIKSNKFLLIKLFIKNIISLLLSLFNKYDVICFTTSDDYKYLDGNQVNRLIETFLNKYKDKRILEFQSGFKMNKSKSKRTYLSSSVLLILINLASRFVNLYNLEEIEKELNKNAIKIDTKKILKKYLASKIVYKFIFRIYRPSMIVTTCYSFMPVIKCANDLKIKNIEFQHGNIINHFAYNVEQNINLSFYPQNLAVFGTKFLKYLVNKHYGKNIFPVGNMFIDYYSKKTNESILKLKKDYLFIISISLQWTVIEKTIEYLRRQAKENKNICFILIPRTKDELNDYSFDEVNIKIFNEYNCYEIAANSDYHMTCYSTCAIEAASLGVENIFLNISGLSEKYLGEFIAEKEFNHLVNFDENLNNILNKNRMTKSSIIVQNEDNIKDEYNKNIQILYKYLEQK
ncbi:hypothetical protein N5915_00985 [Arcobacter lacus]|uniref:hypothetical protein n=1 Tax=Arcobacter lacus TaxID=1912876 RepID=UPI0021BB95D2|nr:hypothetical protein [Arcobacter lacus]MCG3714144.1 hypothetical protein [Aliarcobacter butzleri]MCT7908124.1 hypothetical protein [Arcobacter lacus]